MYKEKSKRMSGLLMLMLCFSIVIVTAYVYEQATMSVDLTVVDVATITLKSSDLGTLNEGELKTITDVTVANLGDAISITTTTATDVYLHLDSDLDSVTAAVSTYDIDIVYATIPGGGTGTVGNAACTLTKASPDHSSITLDAAGTWTFDLEIDLTAGSVSSDTVEDVSIIVTADSTS